MALDSKAVAVLRSEFPAIQQQATGRPPIFFDGPAGTQVHGSVIQSMARYLTEANSNSGGAFSHSRSTDETVASAREALAAFLGAARPDEIVFGPNMTSLTFRLSRAIARTLAPGDEIVVTNLDHDANIAPWVALEEKGIVVRRVDFFPDDCTLDLATLEAALTSRTRLVAVGYASNAVGTINDVARVVAMGHDAGAWVFVDAVHYAPHGLIDVQNLGCDFLACSTYKFFGPHLGVLYGRYGLLEALPAYKVRPAKDAPPDKFETGTPSFEALAGATAAVDYLASVGERFGPVGRADPSASLLAPSPATGRAGAFPTAGEGRRRYLEKAMDGIRTYERALCRRLVSGLQEIPGVSIYGIVDPERFDERVPTIAMTVDGISPREVTTRLAGANIYAWDGNFYALAFTERLGLEDSGGVVRIGLVHYNTAQEVDTFLSFLADLPRS